MLHDNLAKNRDVSSSRSMSQVKVTIDCQGENQHVEGERRRPQEDEPVVVFSARDIGQLEISSSSKVGTKLEISAHVFVERQFVKPAASERKSGSTKPGNEKYERSGTDCGRSKIELTSMLRRNPDHNARTRRQPEAEYS